MNPIISPVWVYLIHLSNTIYTAAAILDVIVVIAWVAMFMYKDCEFIVKNSTELVFEDINYSVDLVTYLEEDVEATNIKIV